MSEIPAELVALGLEERADFARFAYAVSWAISVLFGLVTLGYLIFAATAIFFMPIAVFPMRDDFDCLNIRTKDYLIPLWLLVGMQFVPLNGFTVFWLSDFDPNGSWRHNRFNKDDFDYLRVAIFLNGAICLSSFLFVFTILHARLRIPADRGAVLFHRMRWRKDVI